MSPEGSLRVRGQANLATEQRYEVAVGTFDIGDCVRFAEASRIVVDLLARKRRHSLEHLRQVVVAEEHNHAPAQSHPTWGSDQALDFDETRREPRVPGYLRFPFRAVERNQGSGRKPLTPLPRLLPVTCVGNRHEINIANRITFTTRERSDQKGTREQVSASIDPVNRLGKLGPHSELFDMSPPRPVTHIAMLPNDGRLACAKVLTPDARRPLLIETTWLEPPIHTAGGQTPGHVRVSDPAVRVHRKSPREGAFR